MAIELSTEIINRTDLIGDTDFVLEQGKHLIIKASPRGDDLLDFEAPIDCQVHIAVVITY